MRLLIIEDDREAAEYLVKAFREVGHMADIAMVLRTSKAWNKWLMVQIEPLLASYMPYQEDESKQEVI